jgi:hypothetical protein
MEWEETGIKFEPMLEALRGSGANLGAVAAALRDASDEG